jgi:hypothetical protein
MVEYKQNHSQYPKMDLAFVILASSAGLILLVIWITFTIHHFMCT